MIGRSIFDLPFLIMTVAKYPRDDMEAYADGVALNGLNRGALWGGAYVDRIGDLGLKDYDDMESYVNGASVNGLNGGTGWSGAYVDR